MTAEVSVYIEDAGASASLGLKVQGGGCGDMYYEGFFLRIYSTGIPLAATFPDSYNDD